MNYVKCGSCNNYCDELELAKSEVSDSDVCPSCGMTCPNCNRYINEKHDYLIATNKCIGCDEEF